jgi:glycosyltransferase involved in cell wall biosynthesis
MNLPFCLWLFSKRRDPIWIMFHEVAFPVSRAQPFRHNILGVTTSVMASVIARSAKRIFVSTPGWERLVRRIAPNPAPITWLPVPSNLPVEADSDAVSAVRAKLAPFPGMVVLGHFGTYGSHIAPMLGVVLPPLLLADPRRVVLLLGRGAEAFADEMARVHPGLRRRFHTIADPSGESIATHLSACDVLVQPYPDGACSRRTSLMAGLALGRPIITTDGRLTEPIWKEAGAVGLAPASSAPALVAAVEALLADPEARTKLAVRAARMYADHFALERTVATLRSAPS